MADRKVPAQFVPHETSGAGSSTPSSLVAVEIRPSPENEVSSVRSGRMRASALEPWSWMLTTAASPSTATRGTGYVDADNGRDDVTPDGLTRVRRQTAPGEPEPNSTVHTAPDGVVATWTGNMVAPSATSGGGGGRTTCPSAP